MFKLLSQEKWIVGIDLSDRYTQISYCSAEHPEAVETLSVTAGVEKFNLPTVLCKRPKANQWFIGKEALRVAEEENGILVKDLVSLAIAGEVVQIEGTDIDPEGLLALFLKRCFTLLSKLGQIDRIEAVMFTVKNPDKRLKDILTRAALKLKFREERVLFQSYSESFYYYMLFQKEELWRRNVLLFEYDDGKIVVRRLSCSRNQTPAVISVEEEEFPFAAYHIREGGNNLGEELVRMDAEFLDLCRKFTDSMAVSSVYLVGEEFSAEWMENSLKFLCEGRRVFQGSNLYGKGACLGLSEKLRPGGISAAYCFMGADKLKANIGMKILEHGKEIYYPILEAGTSWYYADKTFEVYVQGGNEIGIMIASVTGKGNKLAQMILEGLAENVSRLKIHIHLTGAECLTVEIEDMGLGIMRPGTHNLWKEEIRL